MKKVISLKKHQKILNNNCNVNYGRRMEYLEKKNKILSNKIKKLKGVKNMKVYMEGLDKHELVQIDILCLPKTIRKIWGIALDKRQANFFKLLGFKKESDFEYGTYAIYPKK